MLFDLNEIFERRSRMIYMKMTLITHSSNYYRYGVIVATPDNINLTKKLCGKSSITTREILCQTVETTVECEES